ncbi:unnamed protein product [Lymnaea stagnalis]|uniref:Uncharacterized protein n=1 Tax=Lymnaea stagnalis TaxID=6523 RepID=A0AAV2IKC0_LYMST
MPRKPSYLRLLSNMSQTSAGGKEEADEKNSTIIGSPKPLGDPVSHLPRLQHSAVYAVKDEIESLMQEEVISALRHMHPISADTLVFVAEYIRNTAHFLSRTVRYQPVNLQFVYGADQSLNMFIEEFERQNLPGYRLTKEGDFYFLIVNKAHMRYTPFEIVTASRGGLDGERKMVISKDERSFSLPCVFPDPLDRVDITAGSRSLIDMVEDTTSSEAGEGKVRPRSCSDAKATQKARCHRGHVDIKAVMSSPEANNQGGTLLQDFKIKEEDRQVEQSLKKSSSFAGLQGRSPGINASCGSRSRHCSAPSGHISVASHSSTMPQSPSVISSRESSTEDGFDGDVSDMELDESASMSDISGCYPELPDFWLLMQIYQERVEVFFHSREPLDSESPTRAAHQAVYDAAINNIQSVCQKVNQALLLKELNKTKTCNALLVPEADEDFKWTNKRSGRAVNDGYEMDEEEDSEEGQGYLAAVMDFVPGHFACDIVWQNKFALHPRLKHVVHRGSPPLGVLVIRQVLNNFIVTNRKNMFVIEELTSRNVFYLRLKEIQVTQDSDVDLDSSASDLSHVIQSRQPQSKGDSDSVSLTSSLGRQYSKVEEVVELTVHGIEEVGQEIKDDLMKMLQNKLDDALLDAICVMLSRNPQCKLKPDDISFIQRPHQAPVESLHLNIPGHCSMYLVALMYYLRQNLLQFLHTPNYVDTNPACQFKDVYDGVCTAIPSDKVYLYVRPQPGGGKGIACVGVNLVDGQGKQVKLLNCPCPTKNNMPSLSDPSEFDKYVQTTVHEKSTSSRPGPTALIQFRIWECGNSDLRVLCDRLMAAVRHALCDIVMEYFMLTSPICSVPRNLMDSYGAPVSSLPASPTKLPPEGLERKHNPLSRKFSIDPPRSVTHSVSMFSSFGELRGNILDTVGKCIDFNTVPTSSDQPRTPASGQIIQSRPKDTPMSDARLQQLTISKYESGEKGNLHQVFCSLMKPWLDFCHSIGVPSVVSTKVQFQSRFSVDFVMKELQQSIPNISNDTALRVFKVIQTSSPSQPPYGVLFTPCKATLKDLQMSRVLDSLAASGGKVTMMAIGRSMEQWHSTVQEDQNIMPSLSAGAIRGYRASQKFLPQVLAEGESKNLDQTSLRSAEKDFVPRQRLLLMVCEGKEMTLLMYNWSNDMVGTIEKTATRLVQWHNARSHVLHSVLAQKMGLFHHFQFSDLQYTPAQNPFTQSTAEVDSLIRHHAPSRDYQRRNSSISNKDRDKTTSRSLKRIIPFDQTYKNMRPPKLMEKLMCSVLSDPVNRHGSHAQELRMHARQDKQLSQQQSLGGASRKDFSDEKIPVCSIKDPVFQQGLHLTDAQKSFVEGEERNKLYQLYLGWLQTSGKNKANPAVMEDYLMQLKRACRLFHYCATPLVFSTSWRQSVVQKTTGKGDKLRQDVSAFNFSGTASANTTAAQALMTSAATTPATPDRTQKTFAHFLPVPSPVSRSRHSSGTSNISFKGKPSEEPGRKGSEAGLVLTGGAATGWGRSKSDAEDEEQWHIDLRRKFLMEYEQYLVSELSFTRVNLQPAMFKGRSQGSTLSNQGSTESSSEGKPGTINLQKTLTGGIIVMEMSFRQEFFCVKMYAIDCCQFKINANQQMHLIFVDECDKYKDLIHVHSFAHDFHLRCVQSYLNSPLDSVFPASFNLDSFLTEFKQIYPYPPSFSRNCVQQDSITLPELPFPGEMLYDCMLKQRGAPHDMTVYRMVGSVDGHQVCEKFSLVSHEKLELSNLTHSTEEDQPEKPETYDAGIVIIDNTVRGEGQNDSMKLVLKYFTVLTRERDCYPIHTLEKVLGESKGLLASTEEKTNTEPRCDKDQEDLSKPVAVRQHICMRKEHVNYRGYSNMQQLALFAALGRQSERGKDKILEMIDMSKKKCRRNYLWQRLLTSRNQADDGKKKRVELEETGDSVLIPLSSLDFCELLQSVVMIPLNEVDPQLDPLFNMPYSWYHGLYTALINKYPGSHCCYSSPNRKTKYIVVFNANNLNMFAMLSLTDNTEQMELCVVMKDKVLDSMKHSPNTPNLPLYSLQTHVEDLVNVCSYQVWASMVQ